MEPSDQYLWASLSLLPFSYFGNERAAKFKVSIGGVYDSPASMLAVDSHGDK